MILKNCSGEQLNTSVVDAFAIVILSVTICLQGVKPALDLEILMLQTLPTAFAAILHNKFCL